MQETFWAARFGGLVDQFGIPWVINCRSRRRIDEIMYTLNMYGKGGPVMPRVAIEDNNRMSLRIPAEGKGDPAARRRAPA